MANPLIDSNFSEVDVDFREYSMKMPLPAVWVLSEGQTFQVHRAPHGERGWDGIPESNRKS